MNGLSSEALRKEIDPETMHCRTTEELSPLEGIIGQERAVKALKFGLDINDGEFMMKSL